MKICGSYYTYDSYTHLEVFPSKKITSSTYLLIQKRWTFKTEESFVYLKYSFFTFIYVLFILCINYNTIFPPYFHHYKYFCPCFPVKYKNVVDISSIKCLPVQFSFHDDIAFWTNTTNAAHFLANTLFHKWIFSR